MAVGRAAEAIEEDRAFGVMSMVPRITEMKYLSGYRVWLRFDDGKEGEVDLQDELWGKSLSR
jgi:hypothetical protein